MSRLALRRSWFLASAILGLHAAAAACALVVFPSWPGALLALALIALGVHAAWSRALATRSLVMDEKPVQRYVSRYLVILAQGNATLLVTRDMLPAAEFRLLRLWALWGRLPRRSVAAVQLSS